MKIDGLIWVPNNHINYYLLVKTHW